MPMPAKCWASIARTPGQFFRPRFPGRSRWRWPRRHSQEVRRLPPAPSSLLTVAASRAGPTRHSAAVRALGRRKRRGVVSPRRRLLALANRALLRRRAPCAYRWPRAARGREAPIAPRQLRTDPGECVPRGRGGPSAGRRRSGESSAQNRRPNSARAARGRPNIGARAASDRRAIGARAAPGRRPAGAVSALGQLSSGGDTARGRRNIGVRAAQCRRPCALAPSGLAQSAGPGPSAHGTHCSRQTPRPNLVRAHRPVPGRRQAR